MSWFTKGENWGCRDYEIIYEGDGNVEGRRVWHADLISW